MSSAEAPTWWDDVEEPAAPRRQTGTEAGSGKVECLSRAHAADFADAFDLDGAFGAPTRRFTRESEQVIVLERRPAADRPDVPEVDEPAPVVEATYEEEPVDDAYLDDAYLGEAPQIDPETGRRTVRVTGRPEAAVAPRRLREIEPRRARRGAVERAASRPDRIALYAVLLGLFLVVLAAASSSAHP